MPTKTAKITGSLQELTAYVTSQLAAGKDRGAIIQQLVERGWPETSASRFVANLGQSDGTVTVVPVNPVAERRDSSYRQHDLWRILRGLGLISGGLIVTAVGLALRDPSVSLFIFSAGVILALFGLLDFLFGLSGIIDHKDKSL